MILTGLDIKKYRDKKGLTQAEFAELAGVAVRTIQNYEAGSNIPQTKRANLRKVLHEESGIALMKNDSNMTAEEILAKKKFLEGLYKKEDEVINEETALVAEPSTHYNPQNFNEMNEQLKFMRELATDLKEENNRLRLEIEDLKNNSKNKEAI